MPLNSESVAVDGRHGGKLRHYFLASTSPGVSTYSPMYCFEAKIDFADVRSGLNETCTVSRALEICPLDDDTLWTPDMSHPMDPDALSTEAPRNAEFRPLPSFLNSDVPGRLETWVAMWLARYFQRRLYRNPGIDLYSDPGESLEDFRTRCADMLTDPCRHELDGCREVFERKLDRIKESHLYGGVSIDFDRARLESQAASRVHAFSERLTALFLGACILEDPGPTGAGTAQAGISDLEHRLLDLEAEARQAIARVVLSYRDSAFNTHEHVVHPTLHDVHVVRAGIVWVPDGEYRR